MEASKKRVALVGVLVVGLLVWWFYPRKPMPLGYVGTAPHLKDVPGKRPTVEIPVARAFIQKFHLTIGGQEVNQNEVTLPRGQEVDLKGRFDFDLADNVEFALARISLASASKNKLGFLTEGGTPLITSFTHTSGTPFGFDVSMKWLVPDRTGEFLLLVDYFVYESGVVTPGRFAIVCPVVLK